MTAQCFVDTNLFIYAASKDPADAQKKEISRKLITSEDVGLSVQVLQEFIAVTAGKKRLGIERPEAKAIVSALLDFPVVSLTAKLVLEALNIQERYKVSYWDSAIIAAAQELHCEVIYSEDLNSGQDYGGIIVWNPFGTGLGKME